MTYQSLTLKLLAILFVGTLAIGCSGDDDGDDPVVDDTDYSTTLTNVTNNVIIETYTNLNNKGADLQTAVANFTIGDDNALNAIKDAWVDAREPWEQSEGFLYGPVDFEGIDPAIDSWPVDVNAIDALLNSGNAITSDVLATNNETRGFHTIEYFVWGLDGNKAASDFTDREVEYLVAATADFKSKTQALYDGWISSGGNYAANFLNAGETGSVYSSQVVALTEFVDGMITIADEVGNGKIEDPVNNPRGKPTRH